MASSERSVSSRSAVHWSTYLWILLAGSVVSFGAMAAFIAIVDPWKALPVSVPIDRPMSNNNQRLLYPMLVRTKNWDSFVFGSSTAMLIDPEKLGAGLGGRFANLALAGGLPWEQLDYLRFILSQSPNPRALMFAMDSGWCAPTLVYGHDNPEHHKFPQWIYRELSWSNLRHVLNEEALFDALNVVRYQVGRFKPDIRDDGYWVFPSYLTAYDPEAARRWLYGSAPRTPAKPIDPPVQIPDTEKLAWTFPWLDLLETALSPLNKSTGVLFVTMPVHVTAQAQPGSVAGQRDEACKQRTARIAAKHGSPVIDMRFHSDMTRNDENYWDSLHYRIHVARRIEELIIAALTGKSGPTPVLRIIDAR